MLFFSSQLDKNVVDIYLIEIWLNIAALTMNALIPIKIKLWTD